MELQKALLHPVPISTTPHLSKHTSEAAQLGEDLKKQGEQLTGQTKRDRTVYTAGSWIGVLDTKWMQRYKV